MQDEKSLYCNKEVYLNQVKPVTRIGDYYKFELPLSMFQCVQGSSAGSLANIDRIDIMNVKDRDANFCIDNMQLVA